MRTVRLTGIVPRAIERYRDTANHAIFVAWSNAPVEPYGKVIPGYGDQSPQNRDHIPVRLARSTTDAAFSVVNLDEIVGPLNITALPKHPSYSGTISNAYGIDAACGY